MGIMNTITVTTMNRTTTSPVKRRSKRLARAKSELDWAAIVANHKQLLARNAAHRRFGYDPVAAVRFVVEKALPLGGSVLDVGTGKGRFIIGLARHLRRITTVDVNAGEQHLARLEASFAGVLDKLSFVKTDAADLPWPAASFDAVVSMNAFHHFTDPCRVFSEMLRVLKPNGKLVLADFSATGFRVMDEIHAAEGKTHSHPPSRFLQWRTALTAAGFTVRRFVRYHQEVLVATPPHPLAGPTLNTTSNPETNESNQHEQRKTPSGTK
jgi:ubiquinone/menaquinone biosynthesis C-methylase UbiE